MYKRQAFNDVRTLRGTLDEVLESGRAARADDEDLTEALVAAELTDPARVSGALGRLKEIFPQLIKMTWVNAAQPAQAHGAAAQSGVERSDREVFSDFISHVTGQPAAAEDLARFDSALLELREATS